MDSDVTCAISQVSAASCKLLPLGRATFGMLKLVNFARFIVVHGRPWDIDVA